jgi:hypothetical protein
MVKIHVSGDGHTPPVYAGYKWDPFSDASQKQVIEDALHILKNNIKGYKPCNDCFKALPGGKTFDALLGDNTIFLSYHSKNTKGYYGATLGKDITISKYSIGMGKWTVAATLVHELAHVNGATGSDTKAEDTLICCKLNGLHDPTIIGSTEPPKIWIA